MDQKTLHTNIPEEKMGYDNPGLTLGSKLSLAPPPSYTEDKSCKKEAFTSVYVLPRMSEKPPKEDNYEPYSNRNVKHATTFSETLLHMLKASIGTGILAMPNAFHNAGYAVGLVGTLVIGFLCTYCIHILITAEYELCRRKKKPSMTYAETLEAAMWEGPPVFRLMAPYAEAFANIFLFIYQLGSCCIYFVFVSSNVKAVADEYFPVLDVRIYMLILLVPFILINWIRNLKLFAPFSTFANIITMISFAIIAYYLLSDIPSLSQRDAVAPFKGMPLFFGTVLFAMEAIGMVMPLENEMENPHKFGAMFGVLNCAMLPITLLYTVVGLFGYLKYGHDAQGTITLNLPHDQLPAQAAKLMLAVAIYITYGLACYVAFDITWNQKLKFVVTKHSLFWEYVTRTVLVVITFLFACAIPNLELFISLIGAFCLSTMGLSFPAMIQLLTFWDYYRGFGRLLFFLKNLVIILIAILGCTIGVTTSLQEIYHKFFALE